MHVTESFDFLVLRFSRHVRERVAHADRSSGRTPPSLGVKPLVPVSIAAVSARRERLQGRTFVHMSSLAGSQMTPVSGFAGLGAYHEATTVSWDHPRRTAPIPRIPGGHPTQKSAPNTPGRPHITLFPQGLQDRFCGHVCRSLPRANERPHADDTSHTFVS